MGVMQDSQKALSILNLLAPVVPTGGATGKYNKFESTQAFKQYSAAVMARAIGGKASRIQLLGTTGTYTSNPNALSIAVDDHERLMATEAGQSILEQAKTRTLVMSCLVGQIGVVVAAYQAALTAIAGKGDWGNANVDPIAELNAAIKAVYNASGIAPNFCAVDFGAWCLLASNPNVLKRMHGADLAEINENRIGALLVNPSCKITVVDTAALTSSYGLGNSSASMLSVLGGDVFVGYNSAIATPYDPSFCKTFAPTAELFTAVKKIRVEEEHSDVLEIDWTSDVEVVASALCKRITVSGANS
jgi:hypothetical protein